MPNTMPSGLKTHDATPAAWGCLGRRGEAGAMQKAKRMMKWKPTPPGIKHGSENHHLIQALINAVVFSDYRVAEEWFALVRKHGIGEGGSLYFPSGDCGYVLPLIRAAEMDGQDGIAQKGREYLSRVVEWMEPMAITGKIDEVVTWLPSGQHPSDRNYLPTGPEGHVFFPGSRALFGHEPPGSGWYMSGPATVLYQWLTGAPGRSLPGRYASYGPDSHMNTWDSWPWMAAMIYGLIPAKSTAQPQAMAQAFRNDTISLVGLLEDVNPGPYKLKFGMEAIRFANGSMLCTASHRTAGPKPPVNWVEYHAPSNTVRMAAPDGLIAYGATGRGEMEWSNVKVWARATSDTGVVMVSRQFRREDVLSHWVLQAKSSGSWKAGKLHPKSETPVPPGPGPGPAPPAPPRRKSDWTRYRYYLIGLALLGLFLWLGPCS